MLRYFPSPYPDESMYSLLVRYNKFVGNDNYFNTFKELFGGRYTGVNLYFVGNLDVLCGNLPKETGFTPEYFIEKHTVFPVYKPFVSSDRLEKAIINMKNGSLGAVHNSLGVTAGSICKTYGLKYCPKCIDSDREKYGEAYLHRIHQVEGVFVCSKHKQMLKVYQPENGTQRTVLFDIENIVWEDSTDQCNEVAPDFLDELVHLSSDSEFLMENCNMFKGYDTIRKKYNVKLHEAGYISPEGLIYQVKLHNDFCQYYSREFLQMLESNIEATDESGWLRTIVRKKSKAVHPIRNLMFIKFLFGSLENFLRYDKLDYLPFGEPPFPCLNRSSNHYGEKTIGSCVVKTDHRSSGAIGVFECRDCGFRYSLKSSDFNKTKFENFKVRRVQEGRNHKEFGELYKKSILMLLEKETSLSRRKIIGHLTKEYRWLYKHEREWLEERLPNAMGNKEFYRNERVDWYERDEEVLGKVDSAIKTMLEEPSLKRISKTSIAREINYRALNRDLDRLPRTMELINKHEEGVHQFHKRKIDVTIRQLFQEEKKLIRYIVLRQANIPDKFQHDYDEYIEEKIQQTIRSGY